MGSVVPRLNRVDGEGSLDMETVLNLKRYAGGRERGRGGDRDEEGCNKVLILSYINMYLHC